MAAAEAKKPRLRIEANVSFVLRLTCNSQIKGTGSEAKRKSVRMFTMLLNMPMFLKVFIEKHLAFSGGIRRE